MFVITQGYLGPLVVTQGYASGEVVAGNGPYTIEQTTLYVPGQQIENIWPVGADRQLVFTPGSFKINITR